MSTADKEHGAYVGKVREETKNYVRKLLQENEELRGLVASLRGDNTRLQEELRIRDRQKAELDRQMDAIRVAGERHVEQYAQLEQHNANLANLYVASYQLHGTVDREAVLAALQEIVVNLVGSEEFAIAERTADGIFRSVAAVGVHDPDALHQRDTKVARSVAAGQPWVRPAGAEGDLTACIPLRIDERVTGYIAIYRLLAHKGALEPLDHELFDLLATHAATALYCTSLAARAGAASGGLLS